MPYRRTRDIEPKDRIPLWAVQSQDRWRSINNVSLLVSWCFKPSQPQRIISGLRETFIKRYIVKRTNKAETRPKEQNDKAGSCCWENLWNEIQSKGPSRQTQIQEQNKKEWAGSVGLCQRHKPQHPHHMKVSPWGHPLYAEERHGTPSTGDLALASPYLC